MTHSSFNWKSYFIVVVITSIWINVSEVFRYFVFVIPNVKEYWQGIEHVGDMNWTIFAIWGLWDMILTAMAVFIFWLYTQRFGNNIRSVVSSAIIVWMFFFVLYWVGAANMGYSDWSILWIVLPLSLLELLIANFISSQLYKKLEPSYFLSL